MRKFTSFAFGALFGGLVVGTWAMANTTVPRNTPVAAAATMNPLEMMMNARELPVQESIDAF